MSLSLSTSRPSRRIRTYRGEINAPRASNSTGGPEHGQFTHAYRQLLRPGLQHASRVLPLASMSRGWFAATVNGSGTSPNQAGESIHQLGQHIDARCGGSGAIRVF